MADPIPQRWNGSLAGLSKIGFDFGEGLFDRIEVGRIGRQQHRLAPVASIVSRTPATLWAGRLSMRRSRRARAWAPELFEIGEEDIAVHRGIDDERRGHPVLAQAGDEGRRLPMAMGNLGDEPPAAPATSAQPRHVRGGAGLVDEDELLGVKPRLLVLPIRARQANVVAILLGCMQAFF